MKLPLATALISTLLFACNNSTTEPVTVRADGLPGTWKLVSSQLISKGDTSSTFPVKDQEMIKIFTDRQFAFFKHDTNGGKDSSAVFDAGSGTYTLSGENYAEHLEYCTARGWENHDFKFTLQFRNDSLIQRGFEKIDSLNIDHEIVEIYKRVH